MKNRRQGKTGGNVNGFYYSRIVSMKRFFAFYHINNSILANVYGIIYTLQKFIPRCGCLLSSATCRSRNETRGGPCEALRFLPFGHEKQAKFWTKNTSYNKFIGLWKRPIGFLGNLIGLKIGYPIYLVGEQWVARHMEMNLTLISLKMSVKAVAGVSMLVPKIVCVFRRS